MEVSGTDTEALERFVKQARMSEEAAREAYDNRWLNPEGDPSEEDFIKAVRERQPLSFAQFVPEPSSEQYAAMDEATKVTCRLCAGKGKRPVTQEEADEWGIEFYPDVMPELPFEERENCNACHGEGRATTGMGSWYEWRVAHWGTKWDASFDGPAGALVCEDADVEASVEAQGATITKYVAVYKFDTAWSPPVPFVIAVSAQFPTLVFKLRFAEVGHGYAGQGIYKAGETFEEIELEVDDVLAPEEQWF